MNYNTAINSLDELLQYIQEIIDKHNQRIEFEHEIQRKNNNVEKQSIVLREDGSQVGVTIYVDDILTKIERNEVSAYDAAINILNQYEAHKNDLIEIPELSHESACENLYAIVINATQNEHLLQSVPHKIVAGDLAIVSRFKVDEDKSFLIHENMCEQFCMTSNEIIDIAIANTYAEQKYVVKDMCDILRESWAGVSSDDIEDIISQQVGPQMIVVTNQTGVNGAVEAFINQEALKEVYEKLGSDFYLLPSSIHEVLCVRAEDEMSEFELTKMVCEVNEHNLEAHEILGNHCYYVDEHLKIYQSRKEKEELVKKLEQPVQKLVQKL